MLLLLLATLNVLLMMTMHTNALPVTDRHNGQRKHSRFHTQTIRQHTHSTVVILVPSLCFKKCHSLAASLSVNASGCWNRVVAYSSSDSICRTVCLSVWRSLRCLTCGKTADWIWIPFGVVSGIGRGMGVLDGMEIVEGDGV